ncbi:trophoblast glycoprotein a [Cololabis saira]|uniref:trophoblast glycoprotein a n=1 Tax=Cololabis saira TaxID=129043 RepID=UPI002AD47F9D|nr:trophoblast glycoprotein a [Cololabis saira]
MPDPPRRQLRCALPLLCALLAAVSAPCPPRCACSQAARTVECTSRDLRAVPRGIPADTRTLVLTGNRIRLGPESLQELRNLRNLSSLVLRDNRIQDLDSRTFSGLPSLRSLDLSRNQLSVIHPEAFVVQTGSLRDLNLSRALHNPSSVVDLAASLRRGSLEALQVLDLSHNGLVLLPAGVFGGLEALQVLDLSHNALRAVPEEGLAELDQVLDRVPGAAVLLGGNPFTCSCSIQPLAAWLNRSWSLVQDAADLRCASPPALRNLTVLEAAAALPLGCPRGPGGAPRALQTSYVFLGLVLGLVGLVFLFVLYLNRRGIKKRVFGLRDACREVWEGYHFQTDSDPRGARGSAGTEA